MTDRWAKARPRSSRVSRSGASATAVGEAGEEAVHLPADGLAQQLVAPAGEQAVDRRPRDPRRPGDVVDRRLGQAESGDALVATREHPFLRSVAAASTGVTAGSLAGHCRGSLAGPGSGSEPEERVEADGQTGPRRAPPGSPAARPGMNDVRS